MNQLLLSVLDKGVEDKIRLVDKYMESYLTS